ncbi:outer membrane protein assembly factor BamB family protein [Halolamina salifodinae]|uniref:Outer membrane protein assembly factor BamB n=1 Tax=Halolamina salifodinae TaxID=1202767 RepID=A0A8T4GRF3_9EURY|nr:PQQ-binding-like beta-propeller repeat protein [Halolamina salifodinae]MBP1985721.1 outer membrane protein assembly factor BamB [Halolamina salifodinae]
MNRRDYLRALAVAGTAGLAGCGGNSEGTSTLPETVQQAMEEAEETDTETATATETPTEPSAVPLDWRTYARDATNARYVAEQPDIAGEYEVNWAADVSSTSRVVAGGETLFVQSDRDHVASSLSAIDPNGEVRWTWDAGEIGGTVYADGAVAGLTRDGDVIVLDPETGERTALVSDVGTEPDVSLNQVSESGLFVTVSSESYDPSELAIVDLTAGEMVHQSTVESMAGVYETVISDGEIILIGAAPVESTWQDNPMMVQRRDLETGEVLGSFERNWLREADMGWAHWTTVDGSTVFSVTNRSGMQYDESRYGMVAYESDGSRHWQRPELFVNTAVSPPLLDDERVYLIGGDTILALDRESGEEQWQYETTGAFSPGSIITDEALLVPDRFQEGEIRVHRIDPASGDATRVPMYTSDGEGGLYDQPVVRLRPASEGIYARGTELRHLTPVDGDE